MKNREVTISVIKHGPSNKNEEVFKCTIDKSIYFEIERFESGRTCTFTWIPYYDRIYDTFINCFRRRYISYGDYMLDLDTVTFISKSYNYIDAMLLDYYKGYKCGARLTVHVCHSYRSDLEFYRKSGNKVNTVHIKNSRNIDLELDKEELSEFLLKQYGFDIRNKGFSVVIKTEYTDNEYIACDKYNISVKDRLGHDYYIGSSKLNHLLHDISGDYDISIMSDVPKLSCIKRGVEWDGYIETKAISWIDKHLGLERSYRIIAKHDTDVVELGFMNDTLASIKINIENIDSTSVKLNTLNIEDANIISKLGNFKINKRLDIYGDRVRLVNTEAIKAEDFIEEEHTLTVPNN